MSGAGTAAKPRVRFCWACTRKLHGNFHRVALVHGNEVVVHAECARRDGLTIKEGAHLAGATDSGSEPGPGSNT